MLWQFQLRTAKLFFSQKALASRNLLRFCSKPLAFLPASIKAWNRNCASFSRMRSLQLSTGYRSQSSLASLSLSWVLRAKRRLISRLKAILSLPSQSACFVLRQSSLAWRNKLTTSALPWALLSSSSIEPKSVPAGLLIVSSLTSLISTCGRGLPGVFFSNKLSSFCAERPMPVSIKTLKTRRIWKKRGFGICFILLHIWSFGTLKIQTKSMSKYFCFKRK